MNNFYVTGEPDLRVLEEGPGITLHVHLQPKHGDDEREGPIEPWLDAINGLVARIMADWIVNRPWQQFPYLVFYIPTSNVYPLPGNHSFNDTIYSSPHMVYLVLDTFNLVMVGKGE